MSPTSRGEAPRDSNRLAPSLTGYALVAAAACAWGTWPLVLRSAEQIAPMSAAVESSIVMVVIALVSGPLALRDRVPRKASFAQWLGVAWLGVGDAMNAFFFFAAYQRTSVAVAVLTHYLAPLLVAMGAPLLLRERPTGRAFVAVGIGFAGLVLLLAPWRTGPGPTELTGAVFGAASAFFYASDVLVSKRIAAVFSGSEQMFYHSFVALPLLALMVPHADWSGLVPRAVLAVAIGSLGPGVFAGLFFTWGLRRIAASRASTLTLLEPLVAVLIGVAVYGEKVGIGGVAGGGLILFGAWLAIVRATSPRD